MQQPWTNLQDNRVGHWGLTWVVKGDCTYNLDGPPSCGDHEVWGHKQVGVAGLCAGGNGGRGSREGDCPDFPSIDVLQGTGRGLLKVIQASAACWPSSSG